MRWGLAQTLKWPGIGPAQMSPPLASTDSMVLTCQNALRNLKALLWILRVGGRGHTSSPEVENSHITWLGVRKCYLTSWTASKPHQSQDWSLVPGPRANSTSKDSNSLRSRSRSVSGRPENKQGLRRARGSEMWAKD